MQIYADVTGCEMRVSRSDQSCALGAAIGAAVCAGAHPDFASAQAAMTGLDDKLYRPIPENHAVYQELHAIYRTLHDAFGGINPAADLTRVMKDLLAIKARQSG
jgi:L-ribulokinase